MLIVTAVSRRICPIYNQNTEIYKKQVFAYPLNCYIFLTKHFIVQFVMIYLTIILEKRCIRSMYLPKQRIRYMKNLTRQLTIRNNITEKLFRIINHRETVLFLAIFCGLVFGEYTDILARISIYSLGFVMIISTTGFSFRSWIPISKTIQHLGISILLNYFIFGGLIILLASYFFSGEQNIQYYIGFILIAAAPPGPSIIPYSAMLKGRVDYAVTTVIGGHLAAIFIAPTLLYFTLGQSVVDPMAIVLMLVKLILLPILGSRILRHPKLNKHIEPKRQTLVKWGFFLVITPIVGMSREVFFNHPILLLKFSLIFFLVMFVAGFLFNLIMKKAGKDSSFIISSTLSFVIKSSAFAAVTAITFFDKEAAMPAAVLSVFVTTYIIFYSIFTKVFFK